jgi:choice-of-anchor A domain-containing protein
MRKLAPLVLALSLTAGAASATAIDPLQALSQFNAIIYGPSTTYGATSFQSDIEGAAVFGGNVSGATVYNKPQGVAQPAGYGALTVFGTTTGNPINIDNGGNAYVATHGSIIDFNAGSGHPAGGFISAPPNTIGDFESAFNSFSTSLSKLSATSTLPTADNNEVIKATPNANGVAIFDITAAQLDAIPSYKINLNGASTVIFNVEGATVNFSANAESGATPADNIIWNFYDATNVTFGTLIAGSVIAPLAHVVNDNQIDGTLVAASWNGVGELHEYAFSGVNPLPQVTSGVPEPATWAMMLAGLGGVGAALRLARGKRTALEAAR